MMYDRTGAPRTVYNREHDDNKLGPTKTAIVFVVVIGCFAVLWPKVFYPMLVGSANEHIKPSPIDKQSGCCDVISELDVKTLKVMSELCGSIVKQDKDAPLSNREVLMQCRSTVLETCGIDISAVLQQQIRLGQSVKQIIDEVRSLNGSLCLKYNFGVAPWKLGVPHRIVNNPSVDTIRQERPPHLRSEMIHPAFRERGRAIPQPQSSSLPPKPTPRTVSGRPGPIPGLRPTIGGAGHVVPTKQSVGGTMGLIMPIYTIAIVIFFSYTVLKLFTNKKPETMAAHLYPPVEPDPHFRREVFETRRQEPTYKREGISSKLVVNAMTALLDEVDEELEARRKASLIAQEDNAGRSNLSNGKAVIPEEEQSSVTVLGLEVTASCEGDKKWNRPDSLILPNAGATVPEPLPPPQEIYLEGALPAQSHLLVSESTTAPEPETGDNEAVVLASKMTLSVISLDSSENGTDESSSDKKSEAIVIIGEDDLKSSSKGSNSSHGSEDFEKIEADLLEEQIDDIIQEAKHIMETQAIEENDGKLDDEKQENGKLDDVKQDNGKLDDVKQDNGKLDDVKQDNAKLDDVKQDNGKLDHVKQDNGNLDDEKQDNGNLDDAEVNEKHFVQGETLQLGKKVVKREIDDDKPNDEDQKVNVEEIFEVEEIIEIEQKPVVVDVPVTSETAEATKKDVTNIELKTAEQLDEREKVADKTKSSASSGTVEDIEELLSRDDEVEAELNEQLEYEPSDNGSEELLDEVRHTGRISEEGDDINDLLEKYGGNETDESAEDEEDEVVDVQEEVEYIEEEEEEEEVPNAVVERE